jgi:hypothetical protein
MDRTTGADNIDIGGGRRGFRDQNRAAGLTGTEVNAAFLNGVQEEILAVIEDADLAPSSGDWTQLLQAIRKQIENVRVLLPIFPEVLTSDGKFTVTSPAAGAIRIAAGVEWVIRGGKKYTSVLTDLATLASKVYHLRWTADAGFALYDTANLAYNPTSAVEGNAGFDSTFDNMLIARVTTDSSNVATITPLVNKPKLIEQINRRDVLLSLLNWGPLSGSSTSLDWARTPDVVYFAMNEWRSNNAGPDGVATGGGMGTARAVGGRVATGGVSRYGIADLEYYYEDDTLNHGTASWILLAMAL